MKQTKLRINLKGMDDLRKAVGDRYIARVGILGDKATRTDEASGLNNAELGAIQIFGSLTKNIPPRDFLRMPLETKRRELLKGMASPSVKAAFAAQDYKRVFALLGVKAEEIIQEAFESAGFGQWPANAPATVARKGSSQPLIDTGQLRRAITSTVVDKGNTASKGVST